MSDDPGPAAAFDLLDGALACPLCGQTLDPARTALRCESGHSFDIARQGYASLLGGRGPGTGDTAEMVAARVDLLAAGHYDPIAAQLVAALPEDAEGLCVDLAGGTGFYLAGILDARLGLVGLGLDLSVYAARRAARAHLRAVAATADIWTRLPLADGSVQHLVNVFGPRNGEEMARVLAPGGTLVVVTPTPSHLGELRSRLGLLDVDERKPDRLDAALPLFRRVHETPLEYRIELPHDDVTRIVLMGPSAHHLEREALATAVAALPDPVGVTVSVVVTTFALASLER